MDINFNNHNILEGYLKQALPQIELKESEDRIIIGNSGGLAYKLFKDTKLFNDGNNNVIRYKICNLAELSIAQNNFNFFQTYLTNAEKHGEKHGFELVSCISGSVPYVSNIEKPENQYISKIGLGSANIESVEKFKRFLEMVKSGKDSLDEQYEKLVKKIIPFLRR